MKLKLNKEQKEFSMKIIEPFANTFLKCMDIFTCTELRIKGKVYVISRVK